MVPDTFTSVAFIDNDSKRLPGHQWVTSTYEAASLCEGRVPPLPHCREGGGLHLRGIPGALMDARQAPAQLR
jgi:hypothetical protein